MESKHTPGPWEYHKTAFQITANDSSGKLVFIAQAEHRRNNKEADARLISAAPDMKEALIKAQDRIKSIQKMLGIPGAQDDTLDVIDAALKKALG